MTLCTMFQRSCDDFWFLFLRDCSEVGASVLETLFKWDKREVILMPPQILQPCALCFYRKNSENSMPCRECNAENDKWTPKDVSTDPEELLP